MLAVSLGTTGLNITICLAIFMDVFGNINHESKIALKLITKGPAILQSMGRRDEVEWLRMEILCLQDLRIRMGSAFFYDKTLVLTTFQMLLESTANLLLLH